MAHEKPMTQLSMDISLISYTFLENPCPFHDNLAQLETTAKICNFQVWPLIGWFSKISTTVVHILQHVQLGALISKRTSLNGNILNH